MIPDGEVVGGVILALSAVGTARWPSAWGEGACPFRWTEASNGENDAEAGDEMMTRAQLWRLYAVIAVCGSASLYFLLADGLFSDPARLLLFGSGILLGGAFEELRARRRGGDGP